MQCVMWIIRMEHNNHIFEELGCSRDQVIASFAGTLFDWTRAWRFTSGDQHMAYSKNGKKIFTQPTQVIKITLLNMLIQTRSIHQKAFLTLVNNIMLTYNHILSFKIPFKLIYLVNIVKPDQAHMTPDSCKRICWILVLKKLGF